MKSYGFSALFLLLLSAPSTQAVSQEPPRPAEPVTFERVDGLVREGQLAEAAASLERLALARGTAQPALSPAEEEVLHRAIETSRGRLTEPATVQSPQEESAARTVLCLARAYFQEELPLPEGSLEPMKVGKDVTRPELLGGPKPEYTPEARQARVAGTVIMMATIDREGCVRQARVLKGQPFGLGEAAAAAVRRWTFRPATYQNRPVAVDYVLTVKFQPDENPEPADRRVALPSSGSR